MHHDIQLFAEYAVTPFVGVWIETVSLRSSLSSSSVTPFVGVWIETSLLNIDDALLSSHPSWVCGLKLVDVEKWRSGHQSHPSWVCGLKLGMLQNNHVSDKSHPSWVCGLKRFACTCPRVRNCHTLRGCVD